MSNTNVMGYKIIDSGGQLADLVDKLKNETAIGVDVEADSMYHFKEKVCLIQMATAHINVVIDPLMVKDLSALKPVFKTKNIKKIFHGADYDVRSLYRDFKISINNLFDTELASRFMGLPETGLEAVLKKRFAIRLDKKFQRKDWSKRPLPREMMDYAAKDARYLLPLSQDLTAELKDKGSPAPTATSHCILILKGPGSWIRSAWQSWKPFCRTDGKLPAKKTDPCLELLVVIPCWIWLKTNRPINSSWKKAVL
jgi:ribonuclease D